MRQKQHQCKMCGRPINEKTDLLQDGMCDDDFQKTYNPENFHHTSTIKSYTASATTQKVGGMPFYGWTKQ